MSDKLCCCGIRWRALRLALGYTQYEFGEIIQRSERQVRNIEAEGAHHQCPDELVTRWVKTWMQDPRWREKLRAAGWPLEEEA